MNNQKVYQKDWLSHAVDSLTDKLSYYLDDRDMSLEQATEATKADTCAGPKAWTIALSKIGRTS